MPRAGSDALAWSPMAVEDRVGTPCSGLPSSMAPERARSRSLRKLRQTGLGATSSMTPCWAWRSDRLALLNAAVSAVGDPEMTTLSPESSEPMEPAGSFFCPAHPTVPIAVSPRRAETATAEALTRAAGRRCPTLPCGNGEGFGRRSIMLGPSQTLAAALRREPGKRGAIRIEKRDLSSKRDIPELAGEGRKSCRQLQPSPYTFGGLRALG